jgi:hypothetical protein
VLIYVGMFAISFVVSPVFLDRYLLFTTIPLFLVLGRMVDGLFDRHILKWAALGLVLAGMGIHLNLNPSNERPARELADRILLEKQPDTPLFICPPYRDLVVLYHLDREAFADYRHQDQRLYDLRIFPINSAGEIPQALTDAPKILYFDADSEFTLPGNGILEKLRRLFPGENVYEFGKVYRLYVFTQ